MAEGVVLGETMARRVAEAVRWVEAMRSREGGASRPWRPSGPAAAAIVRCTSATADANGNYPAVVTYHDGSTWQDESGTVALKMADGSDAVSGRRYLAKPSAGQSGDFVYVSDGPGIGPASYTDNGYVTADPPGTVQQFGGFKEFGDSVAIGSDPAADGDLRTFEVEAPCESAFLGHVIIDNFGAASVDASVGLQWATGGPLDLGGGIVFGHYAGAVGYPGSGWIAAGVVEIAPAIYRNIVRIGAHAIGATHYPIWCELIGYGTGAGGNAQFRITTEAPAGQPCFSVQYGGTAYDGVYIVEAGVTYKGGIRTGGTLSVGLSDQSAGLSAYNAARGFLGV